MRFAKLTGYIFASILAVASGAQPAQAELVGYRLFLQDDGVTLYTGELFIDDSQTGNFYTFDQIKAAGGSLSITLEDATVTLDDVLHSSEDGIITDASGAPIAFGEPLNSPNLGAGFASSRPAEFFIHPSIPNAWMFVRHYTDSSLVNGDAIVFAPIQTSEPTADAGPDQMTRAGAIVKLDGSGSFGEGTGAAELGYRWQLVQKPIPSTTVLVDADTATPHFTADVSGDYTVALVVTDKAGVPSAPDTVLINGNNRAPTADAGEDRLVVVNESVALDGSGSADPENDPITYAWTIVAAPAGSKSTIINADTAAPSFTPDLVGIYRIQLAVSDSMGPGNPGKIEITTTTADYIAELAKAEAAGLAADAEFLVTLKLQNLLRDGNFDALEQILAEAEESYLAGDKSESVVSEAYAAFASAAPEFEPHFAAWMAAKPASHRPYLARGIYHQHIGWVLRGINTASHTTDQQLELMRDRFVLALQDMKVVLKRKPELGLTYSYMIGMLMVTGERESIDALVQAGLDADPRSYSIRSRYLHSLTPWWNGWGHGKSTAGRVIELLRKRNYPVENRYPVYVPEEMLRFVGEIETAASETPSLAPLLGYIDFNVAETLRREGRNLEAVKYYERANEIAGGKNYLLSAGDNLYYMKRYKDALAIFGRILESDPENRGALQSRARTYLATRDYTASLADIDRALALDPKNPDLISDKAYTLSYAGRHDEALAMFDDTLVYGEFNPDMYYYRGRLYLRYPGNKISEAQDDFKRAVELNPVNARFWFDYGRSLNRRIDCKAKEVYRTYLDVCQKYANRCDENRLTRARQAIASLEIPNGCISY